MSLQLLFLANLASISRFPLHPQLQDIFHHPAIYFPSSVIQAYLDICLISILPYISPSHLFHVGGIGASPRCRIPSSRETEFPKFFGSLLSRNIISSPTQSVLSTVEEFLVCFMKLLVDDLMNYQYTLTRTV